ADLGLTPSPEPIPVYLVARSPWPHGVTHRTHQGGGVCWIGADGDSGGLLIETILHEATHALDVRSREGVLAELRARLAASPLQGSPSRQRDIAHTLIFVEAAETVRRVLDPQHIDYGEASGYYARVGRVAEVERTIWRQHLDGRVSREQAIAAIVDSLAPALASPVGQ
ncbi:MAG: hypothetical protein QUU85_13785, partial [Candidatus Eisenbacteria bacterium]|nr:hypothetical protein [Candidatus Eisenbacteria bacterium]